MQPNALRAGVLCVCILAALSPTLSAQESAPAPAGLTRLQPGTLASTEKDTTDLQPSSILPTEEGFLRDMPLGTPVAAVGQNPAPLDFHGKTEYFFKATFSREALTRVAIKNAIGQINGSEFGGGMEGYSESFASRYGRHLTNRSVQYAVGALRGEDPRFRRSNKDGFWARTSFAVSRTVIADMDNGGTSIAAGRLAGAFAAGAVSAYWLPNRPDPLRSGLANVGTNIAMDAGMRMVREFWPDIKRRFKK